MAAGNLFDHLTGDRPTFRGDAIELPPYAAAWLTAAG
jgi:amylosucrase